MKHKLQHNKLDKEYYSLDENKLLMRKVVDGGHEFHAIYLANVLIFQVLHTAHDDLGQNGFPRTYAALKDRRIPQVPENMYWQAHQLQIGVG